MNAGQWWRVVKRATGGFILLAGAVAVGIGVYTLYLAHEIASAEKRVVVPLPTEAPDDTPTVGPTPTPLTPYTPTPARVPATTFAAAVTPPAFSPEGTHPPIPLLQSTATATARITRQPAPLPDVPTAIPFAATLPPTPRPSPPTFAPTIPVVEPTLRPPIPTATPPPAPMPPRAIGITVIPLVTIPVKNTATATATATPLIIVLATVTSAASHTPSPLVEVPRGAINPIPVAPTATPLPPPLQAPSPTPPPPKMLSPPMPAASITASAPNTTSVLRGGVGAATGGESDGHEAVWGGKQYVHILLMGIDRRDDEPARSDTMILATVDLWDGAISLLSIPRDLMVPIAGHGEDRINAAFAYGQAAHPRDPAAGPALAVKTVSAQFNVPIEHYLFVDFKGYKEIIDAIGGIDIVVPQAIDDPEYPTDDYGVTHLHFDVGKQHMDGDRALAYARTRHSGDDDQRRERQLQVMQTVLLRALQIDTVRTLPDIVKRLGNNMQTSMPYEAQLSLVKMGRKIQANGVRSYSIKPPLVRPYVTSAGADVYLGDWANIRPLVVEATTPKRKAKP